jgi:uncharacterized protein DUF4190
MTEWDKPGQPSQAPPPQPPYPYGYGYGSYPGGYPPPPPQPYSGYTPPPPAPKNGLGIAALVTAIVALVAVWSVIGGIILGLVAVIIGFVGRGRVKRGEATNGGVAVAGIVLGFLAIVVSVVFIAIWVNVFNEVGGTDYVDCLSRAGSDQQAVEGCADQFRDRIEGEFNVSIAPTT